MFFWKSEKKRKIHILEHCPALYTTHPGHLQAILSKTLQTYYGFVVSVFLTLITFRCTC